MDELKTKAAVPIPPVGAGGEQPVQKTTGLSIAEDLTENNPLEQTLEEKLRLMQRMSDPAYLHTVSMSELYETVYQSRPPVIDGLLYSGTYLFAGAPKVGKSFLMAQLAYHVSTGLPLWGCTVHKGTVLYLALEDDHRRLQGRLYRMFGMDGTDNLRFAIYAKQLGVGLEEQLKKFVREHSDTKLIIIDTLQKVREAGGDKYSYANDYEVVGKLKRLADDCGICLLLVHHTRKQQADDKFDMISGTNGLLGAAGATVISHQGQRAACVGTGADGNGAVGRTARPGVGGHSRSCNNGQAHLERHCYRVGDCAGCGFEAQYAHHAPECERWAAVE